MTKKISSKFLLPLIALFLLVPAISWAAYNRFFEGEDVVIGEFVSDDNYQATTSPCTISVSNPSGTPVATNAAMTARADGWHYYDLGALSLDGIWSAIMTCGTTLNGDLAKLDKSFIISPANVSTSTVSDAVWNYNNRTVATSGLASEADILQASSSIISSIASNTSNLATQAQVLQASSTIISSIAGLNNISAADVWSYNINRSLTDYATSSIASAVWSNPTRALTDYATSSIAAAVWSNSLRTLTDYATSSISAAVWSNPTRSLTDFGNLVTDIWANPDRSLTNFGNLVSDIWNNTNRTLTDYDTSSIASVVWSNANRSLTSADLGSGDLLATQSALNSATSSIISEVLQNRSLISALNNISAADVWAYAGGRSIDGGVNISTSSLNSLWDTAASNLTTSGSIGQLLVNNIDAKISSRGTSSMTAADVWDAANRTLTDYSTSSVALAVWSNAARTLTNYGNDITAADVWNVLSSTLTATGTVGNQLAYNLDTPISTRADLASQQAGWTVVMSNVDRVLIGQTYRAKVFLTNYQSIPTNPISTPTLTLYDANRNIVASNIPMNNLSAGVYEYTYSIPSTAAQGLWEAVVSSEVSPGKIIQTNDYWVVEGSPAQVIINGINNAQVPNISANVTITDEGITGYEYHYEWCVVPGASDICGGGHDIYYATASKFINSGQDFNTNLTATVPTAGNYFFKLVVYFGTEKSGSSRSFTATGATVTPPSNNGGGGGSGGGGSVSPTPVVSTTCNGADFNHDGKVNSIDLSILLAFWKTPWPFRNSCVDVNGDKQVDSVDFSILMYQWGTKR